MKDELWELYPEIWPTKASFFSWLRGCLRRAVWEKYPIKIQVKNEGCSAPPDDYQGRAKSGAFCSLSGVWVPKSYLEVDHIIGNVSLKDWNDVEPFVKHLCAVKENLQLVSKEAHKIKSYAEKQGLSFADARAEKEAIRIIKAKQDLTTLESYGIIPARTQAARRKQLAQILSQEYGNMEE